MAIKDTWDQIFGHRVQMVDRADALPGRDAPSFEISGKHAVLGTDMTPPFPEHLEVASFALGCFWGAERL
jgi:peptide-methionine (S)-S-oxide reductase